MARSGSRWAFALIATTVIGALAWAERRRALRARVSGDEDRVATNLAIAGLGAIATSVAMAPVVVPLARRTQERRIGLLWKLPLPASTPGWVRDAAAVVLLDYTLYWWHVLEHRFAWLYRFHQVHHADLELDSSTAARFHFGELLLSVPWRAAQVLLIGVSPRALTAWERLTLLSVAFHHSNVRLPLSVERVLSRLVVTPRLHGIHHSIVADEQDSNWSSGLTLWDRLHGTYRADVPQADIEIGVPAWRDPADVGLARSIAMPLHPLPPWRLPGGEEPRREDAMPSAPRELAP